MGIRNKWSIAFGIAKAAYENGANLIFTYMGEENKDKIEELLYIIRCASYTYRSILITIFFIKPMMKNKYI